MSQTTNIPASLLNSPMVDPSTGMMTAIWRRWMADTLARTVSTLTPQGQITPQTPIEGRPEPLAVTVQNVDRNGKLQADGVGFTVDAVADGVNSPLAGGVRGFQALDANNRLESSFRNNPLNVAIAPTTPIGLTNDGIKTVIQVPANTQQFGPGVLNYNSGSVDPGVFGTFYIYADDPDFAGGTVNYQFTTTPIDQTANDGRIPFGAITTLAATPKTGGGYSGGTTPRSSGGRGYPTID